MLVRSRSMCCAPVSLGCTRLWANGHHPHSCSIRRRGDITAQNLHCARHDITGKPRLDRRRIVVHNPHCATPGPASCRDKSPHRACPKPSSWLGKARSAQSRCYPPLKPLQKEPCVYMSSWTYAPTPKLGFATCARPHAPPCRAGHSLHVISSANCSTYAMGAARESVACATRHLHG